jgi:hypothetical protein
MQFRLSTLFLLAVVLWSSLAVFGGLYGAVYCAMVVVLAVRVARGPLSNSLGWNLLLVGLLVAYLILVMLLTPVQMAVTDPRRGACQENLKQIALALHNYERANGSYPPAYVADKKGQPMHSWRVLILPYLEDDFATKLYKKYDFNEPWDGPHNYELRTIRPRCYVCPSDAGAANPTANFTNYVAVVGANAAWSGEKPRKAADLAPAESTISVVEIAQNRFPWTAPRDFNIDSPPGYSGVATVSSNHSSAKAFGEKRAGGYAAMADGHVSYLSGTLLDSDKAPNLYKIGGCPEEYCLGKPAAASQPHPWTDGIALTVWLASVGLLLYRAARTRKTFASNGTDERAGHGIAVEPGQTQTKPQE